MQLLLAASAQVMSRDLLVLASLREDVGCSEDVNCAANPAIAKIVPKNSHRRLSPVYKVWKFDAVMDAGTRNGRDVFSARRFTKEPSSVLFWRVARIDGKAFMIRGAGITDGSHTFQKVSSRVWKVPKSCNKHKSLEPSWSTR